MASEITPLLESQALHESQPTLPPLQPAIELLYLVEITREDLYRALPAFSDYPLPSRMAFLLAALLLTRARIAEELEALHGRSNGDVHVLKIKQERTMKVLQDTWDTYVCADDTASTQVSETLWTSIPLDQDSSNSIRVADLLYKHPELLSRDSVISQGILSAWKDGLPQDLGLRASASWASRSIQSLEAFSTPRVAHSLHLAVHLIFIVTFANFLLFPTMRTPWVALKDMRIVLLILYAVTSIIEPRVNISHLPHLCLLVAFILSVPNTPADDSLSHFLILVSFSIYFLQLLLPYSPTPLLLFPPFASIPPALELIGMLRAAFLRPWLYFLPAVLATCVILSISLRDPESSPSFTSSLPPIDFPDLRPTTPMTTRIAFFALFLLVVFLAFAFGLHCLIRNASRPSPPPLVDDGVALSCDPGAIRVLHCAVLAYSTPRAFPPPLNVIPMVLVVVPAFLLRSLGQHAYAKQWSSWAETVLWRMIVLPLGLAFAGIWRWK